MGTEKPASAQAEEATSGETIVSAREGRRNFALGLFNGATFRFAEALIDPPLVLTWFVSRLTDSNFLTGLVAPLGMAGWFLPQVFVSARIQRMERKMPVYSWMAVVRTIIWLGLAAALWLVDDPSLLLVSFFVLYVSARAVAGPAGLAFFDVVAKTIPVQRRGSFFTWRQFVGGLLALGGGWIVKTVLSHPALPFPRGNALLFLLYTLVMSLGLWTFVAIREPPGAVVRESVTLRKQFQRAGNILRQDSVYRCYTTARITIILAGTALPFYSVYAKSILNAPEGMVGVYVTTRVAALLLSNLPWGRISDRRGNRLVMRLANLGNGVTALMALALVGLVKLLPPTSQIVGGGWLPYLALPLFFLNGAIQPALMLIGNNFLLELTPEAERPLYLGFSSTLAGIAVLVSGLGGLVVDLIGFTGLFGLSLGLCLVGYVLATELPEPRETER